MYICYITIIDNLEFAIKFSPYLIVEISFQRICRSKYHKIVTKLLSEYFDKLKGTNNKCPNSNWCSHKDHCHLRYTKYIIQLFIFWCKMYKERVNKGIKIHITYMTHTLLTLSLFFAKLLFIYHITKKAMITIVGNIAVSINLFFHDFMHAT